jgi:hypothetical protein
MSRVNIENRVFRLKNGKKTNIPGINESFDFHNGQEFHIVADVLYMGGFPIPPTMQTPFMEWVLNNKNLFVEDTRNF